MKIPLYMVMKLFTLDLLNETSVNDKTMAVNADYLQFIEEQLSEFGPFESKKMFGGVGFFSEAIMFALIAKGVFRLRVNESNVADYEKYGMKPFQPKPDRKGMPYWEVPVHILEDKAELAGWAHKAFEISRLAKKK